MYIQETAQFDIQESRRERYDGKDQMNNIFLNLC